MAAPLTRVEVDRVPRRIVVTGASGFIGRHLVEALGTEAEIFALARGSPGSRGLSRLRELGGRVRSPPDGDTPYAESKRAGERMLEEYRGVFRPWVVRFAALFSDWCEYEPLFRFVETWLSRPPRGRILAGHGLSAVPYLHVRDAVAFLRALIERRDRLPVEEALLASTDGATTHREIFEAATAAHFGQHVRPILVPRPLCRAGLWALDAVGRGLGATAFERPWMGRFIDLSLTVDARLTRDRLGWSPRARLDLVRRMPFLVQNRKSFGAEWQRRNHAALRGLRRYDNLRVRPLLERRAPEMAETLADYVLDPACGGRFAGLQALGRERHPLRAVPGGARRERVLGPRSLRSRHDDGPGRGRRHPGHGRRGLTNRQVWTGRRGGSSRAATRSRRRTPRRRPGPAAPGGGRRRAC